MESTSRPEGLDYRMMAPERESRDSNDSWRGTRDHEEARSPGPSHYSGRSTPLSPGSEHRLSPEPPTKDSSKKADQGERNPLGGDNSNNNSLMNVILPNRQNTISRPSFMIHDILNDSRPRRDLVNPLSIRSPNSAFTTRGPLSAALLEARGEKRKLLDTDDEDDDDESERSLDHGKGKTDDEIINCHFHLIRHLKFVTVHASVLI